MTGTTPTSPIPRNGSGEPAAPTNQNGALLTPNGRDKTSRELLYAAEGLTDLELVDAVRLSIPDRIQFKTLTQHVGVEIIPKEGQDLRIHSHLLELSKRLDDLFDQLSNDGQRGRALIAAYQVLASAGISDAVRRLWHDSSYHKQSILSGLGVRMRKPALHTQNELFYSMCRALGHRTDSREVTALRAILSIKLIEIKEKPSLS